MESLKEPRDDVEAKLQGRIELGRELAARGDVSATEIERDLRIWHDYNKHLIAMLVTGIAEVEAYDAQTSISIVRNEADQVSATRQRITEYTDRLESLQGRLELFPVAAAGGATTSDSNDRRRYLESLYELVDGEIDTRGVRSDEIGDHAGLRDSVRKHAEAYLRAEGDITYLAFGPTVALTHQGRRRIEAKDDPVGQLAPQAQNVTNFFGDVTNSAIAVGSGDAIFTPPAAEQVAQIHDWVAAVSQLDLASLAAQHREVVDAKVESVAAELKSPAPDSQVIVRGIKVVQRILENAAGTLGAQAALGLGAQLIGGLG